MHTISLFCVRGVLLVGGEEIEIEIISKADQVNEIQHPENRSSYDGTNADRLLECYRTCRDYRR